MKTTTIHKHLAAAALTLCTFGALAGAAHAQSTPAADAQGRHGHATPAERQAKWSAMLAKRQAALHDALRLTPSQEGAWSNFINAIRPDAPAAHGDRAAWASMPAPQRLQQAIIRHKERTARMESQLAALNTFYSVLTPQQRQAFDAASHMGGEHGHGAHHSQ